MDKSSASHDLCKITTVTRHISRVRVRLVVGLELEIDFKEGKSTCSPILSDVESTDMCFAGRETPLEKYGMMKHLMYYFHALLLVLKLAEPEPEQVNEGVYRSCDIVIDRTERFCLLPTRCPMS